MRHPLKIIALVALGACAVARMHVQNDARGEEVAIAPASVAAQGVRWVYGPGASGMGYYQLAAPTATGPTVQGYAAPNRQAPARRTGGRVRDWTTGHSLPSGGLMNKPWLRPSR